MTKPLFLHLGPLKTGSTAIQRFLSSNDATLLKHGLHYIKTLRWKRDGSHNPSIWIFLHKYSQQYPNTYSIQYVKQQDTFLAALSDEISGLSDYSLVLSSEGIPSPSGEALDELISLFQGRPIKAIVYIRDFYSQALSFAATIVRFQDSLTYDDRLGLIYDNHIKYFQTCYMRCLTALTKATGNDNIIFRPYGMRHFTHGSIYSDIPDALGTNLTDDFIVPDKLQFESLTYCESIYFEDVLNRLTLKTSRDTLEEHLLAWEKLNKGTRFYFPGFIADRPEKDAEELHRFLLTNYLDDTYIDLLTKPKPLVHEAEYSLPYSTFINILDYLDLHIPQFKADFMEAFTKALDRTYAYELQLREFDNTFMDLIRDKKAVALWGCGDIADKLFMRHTFLTHGFFYIIDKNTGKQGSSFRDIKYWPHPSSGKKA
jgi:hypothetical protein